MPDQFAKDKTIHDVRCVKRNIEKGYISEEDNQKYLDTLEDVSEKAEVLQVNQQEEISTKDEKRRQIQEARERIEENRNQTLALKAAIKED